MYGTTRRLADTTPPHLPRFWAYQKKADLETRNGRICLQCHTLNQVVVGAAVGTGTGALWYLLYSKVSLGVRGAFPCSVNNRLLSDHTLVGLSLRQLGRARRSPNMTRVWQAGNHPGFVQLATCIFENHKICNLCLDNQQHSSGLCWRFADVLGDPRFQSLVVFKEATERHRCAAVVFLCHAC